MIMHEKVPLDAISATQSKIKSVSTLTPPKERCCMSSGVTKSFIPTQNQIKSQVQVEQIETIWSSTIRLSVHMVLIFLATSTLFPLLGCLKGFIFSAQPLSTQELQESFTKIFKSRIAACHFFFTQLPAQL